MELKKKTISVVISNYNHSEYLPSRIKSFFNQSLKPCEIIVVDDKSSDNSVKLLNQLKKKYKILKIIRNKKNLGPVRTANIGIKKAKGKYIYPCAADDIILNGFFKKCVKILNKDNSVNICTSIPGFFENKTKQIIKKPWLLPFKKKNYYTPNEIMKLQKKKYFHIWSHCSILRTKFMKRQLFNKNFNWYCDWYVVHKSSLLNGVYFVPDLFALCRVLPNSYSSNLSYKDKKKTVKKIMDYLLYKENIKIRNLFIDSLTLSAFSETLYDISKEKKYRIFFRDKKMFYRIKIFEIKKVILKLIPKPIRVNLNFLNKFRLF